MKYYDEENARWGYLNTIQPDAKDVARAYRAWARRFLTAGVSGKSTRRKSGPFLVQWRHYRDGYSFATEKEITLTHPVTWLCAIHEFAHLIEQRERTKTTRRRYHGKRHAELVDEMARDLIRKGWDVKR